jgi:hypothetical protein
MKNLDCLLTGIRVVLSATHEKALDVIDLEDLNKFAVEETGDEVE